MRQIEPGCLALVVPSSCSITGNAHAGSIITVQGLDGCGCSQCKSTNPLWIVSGGNFEGQAVACESQIMRIDGDPDEQEIEERQPAEAES